MHRYYYFTIYDKIVNNILKLQYEPGCPLPFWGPPIYIFEDPELNEEAEQDSMMVLDYRNLHVHIECVCACVWMGA